MLLYDNGFAGILISIIASTGLVFGFDDQQTRSFKVIWWGVMMTLLLVRLADTIWWNRKLRNTEFDGPKSIQRYITGTIATGFMWATYCVTLFEQVGNLELTYMIVIVSAMAGGAATVLAAHKYTAMFYSALMLAPFSVMLLFSLDNYKYLLGILGISFAVVMVVSARKSADFTKQAIMLKNYNAVLVNHMEQEVAHRTRQIYELSNIDPLTKLYNRNAFLVNLKRQLSTCEESQGRLALLFIDLDGFKKINDSIGHETGDMVLKQTAKRLKHHCPDEQLLCRWGGDEFLMAMLCNEPQQAVEWANQIIAKISGAYSFENNRLTLGGTIGIAIYPDHCESELKLIQLADTAMYYQKKRSAGSAGLFSEHLGRQLSREQKLKDALAEAIENNQLHLAFQPIVDAKNYRPVAFEALLRWRLDDKEISPVEFIPLAEQYGQIRKIGTWVLQQACITAAKWPKYLAISVNVSVIQLQEPDFVELVKQALEQSQLSPRRLHIEITESVFAADKSALLDTIRALQNMEIAVSIDDFGTEYSSLSVLQELSANVVKIDRTFVRSLETNGLPIIKAVLNIAKAFNYKVVAEGVEMQEQASMLTYLGVDYLQGYYYSKPMDEVALQHYLTEHCTTD